MWGCSSAHSFYTFLLHVEAVHCKQNAAPSTGGQEQVNAPL